MRIPPFYDMENHHLDEDGDHDPDRCYPCLVGREVKNECRCGACCRSLILEALPQDAEREPLIKERGSEIRGFKDEVEGYLLNGPGGPCVFLDQRANLCTIYPTRPLMCRLFDCDGEGGKDLIDLGVLDKKHDASAANYNAGRPLPRA